MTNTTDQSVAGDLPEDPLPLTELTDLSGLSAGTFGAVQFLGRSLRVPGATLEDTLAAMLRATVAAIPGARDAGLNLFVRGRFVPQAVYGQAPPECDALQQRTGVGPCIDSSRDQRTIVVDDMGAETRWPEFVELAASLGIRSMLCVPLWVTDAELGSLSLYADEAGAFGERETRAAELVATLGALAIADVDRAENLRRALQNRDVIGQAKGILMERLRITSDQAFAMLSQASQATNRKVAVVAEEFTNTGELPA